MIQASPIERFLALTEPVPEAGCWLWLGSERNGYGEFWDGEQYVSAHRYAYQYFIGALGDAFACHKCDTRLCVNPLHLFAGTPKDNVQDHIRKGRRKNKPKRAVVGFSPQTGESVRFNGVREVAASGFNPSHVSACCRGKLQSHAGLQWSYL